MADQFVEYMLDYYGQDGVYVDDFKKPFTEAEVINAYNYLSTCKSVPWSDGESFDRERARDYVLLARGEKPWGGIYNPDDDTSGIEDLIKHFDEEKEQKYKQLLIDITKAYVGTYFNMCPNNPGVDWYINGTPYVSGMIELLNEKYDGAGDEFVKWMRKMYGKK